MLDIRRNNSVKYRQCLYLVKDFKKVNEKKYRLEYFFRTIKKENAELQMDVLKTMDFYLKI